MHLPFIKNSHFKFLNHILFFLSYFFYLHYKFILAFKIHIHNSNYLTAQNRCLFISNQLGGTHDVKM